MEGWTISSLTTACTRLSQMRQHDGAIRASNLIRRKQAIEFGIEFIVVRVVAVLWLAVEIFAENVRRRRLSLNQPAGAPTFACCNPYAFSLFQKPGSPKLTANAVESVPETGQSLAGLHKCAFSHDLSPSSSRPDHRHQNGACEAAPRQAVGGKPSIDEVCDFALRRALFKRHLGGADHIT